MSRVCLCEPECRTPLDHWNRAEAEKAERRARYRALVGGTEENPESSS
jgi:hypothetical protein